MTSGFPTVLKYECHSLIRRPGFWVLFVLLPLLTGAVAPRMIWQKNIFLGFPLIVFSVYVIPLFIYAPAWLRFRRSAFGEELRLTSLAPHALLASFFLPRILISTVLFGVAYSSLTLVSGSNWGFFGPTQYACVWLGDPGPFLLPSEFAISLGISDVYWSDWRIPFTLFFFVSYITYGACVIAYISERYKSFTALAFRFMLLTVVMDVSFYIIAWSTNDNDPSLLHLYPFRSILMHLSRAWFPWWYFVIKCLIASGLIALTTRRLKMPKLLTRP